MKPARKKTRNITKFTQHRPASTARTYKGVLAKFLNFVYELDEIKRIGSGDRDPIDLEFYDPVSLEYLNDGRDEYDFVDDMRDFLRANGDLAPKTSGVYKSAIISWLAENHVYLHQQMTRRIPAGGRAQTRDRIPTTDEMRRILNHADLHLKAYLLTLSSSGLRPGEAAGLEWRDLDLDRGVVHVRPEISKTKEPRTTFISLETVAVLEEWRNFHGQYLEKADALTVTEDFERDENLVFLTTYSALRNKYTRVLEKTGLDECDPTTKLFVLRMHTMRKFFRTRLPQGGCSIDVVEALLGHRGYLSDAYVRLEIEDMETAYRAAEHELWVYKTRPINEGELRQLEQENLALRNEVSDIRRQVAAMTAMQTDVAITPAALQRLIDERIRAVTNGEGRGSSDLENVGLL